jgi:hypothetical protein
MLPITEVVVNPSGAETDLLKSITRLGNKTVGILNVTSVEGI